jgi:hypothetical protein
VLTFPSLIDNLYQGDGNCYICKYCLLVNTYIICTLDFIVVAYGNNLELIQFS